MGASRCFSPVRGNAMRVTQLDGCGRPVYGDESVGVSDGFVSVAFTANTDDGEEINVTNAAGKTCVRETPCPTFLGYGVEIEFCQVDPALFAILTGQSPDVDYTGAAAGFRVNSDISACDSGFALELWTGVPGVACDPTGDPDAVPGGYLLLPYLQGGIFGDFTVENGAISFTVTGAATKTGSGWGVGPYDVVRGAAGPQPLETPIVKGDHLLVRYTDVAPPPPACGTQPLLDPSGEDLTGITATVNGLDATFAPLPAGADPWWVDFGDGTWDYAGDGATLSHTYGSAGDFTYIGHRGSSSITGTITTSTVGAPTVTTVAPSTGAVGGGDVLTISGTNLTGATGVTFGATAGTAFSVVNATTISVTTPAHAAGAVSVVVQHPSGNVTKANGFTYA